MTGRLWTSHPSAVGARDQTQSFSEPEGQGLSLLTEPHPQPHVSLGPVLLKMLIITEYPPIFSALNKG